MGCCLVRLGFFGGWLKSSEPLRFISAAAQNRGQNLRIAATMNHSYDPRGLLIRSISNQVVVNADEAQLSSHLSAAVTAELAPG
jgi:hypothetical protein